MKNYLDSMQQPNEQPLMTGDHSQMNFYHPTQINPQQPRPFPPTNSRPLGQNGPIPQPHGNLYFPNQRAPVPPQAPSPFVQPPPGFPLNQRPQSNLGQPITNHPPPPPHPHYFTSNAPLTQRNSQNNGYNLRTNGSVPSVGLQNSFPG